MRKVPEAQAAIIRRYLALDEEELYALIPPYLSEQGSTMYAPWMQKEEGKAYFEKVLGNLRVAVCEDFDWPSKRLDPGFSDTVSLVASVADVIATYVTGVPPFIISSLLVRRGLDTLCDSYENPSET